MLVVEEVVGRRQLEVIELAQSLDVTVVRKDIATGTVDRGIMLETCPCDLDLKVNC